jgi:hypothetical protein
VAFFKQLIRGRVGSRRVEPGLPFPMLIDQIRRQQIKQSIYPGETRLRLQGLRVTRNFMEKLEGDGVYSPTPLEKAILEKAIRDCEGRRERVQ